jgi:ABC-type antimicrobial peptide transport system permease subunit
VASNRVISPGYLEAVGTPLRRGRGFTDADVLEAERVLIIDEVIADRYFPDEDPIGQRLVHFGSREWTIVGVASAVHDRGPGLPADPTIYMPAAQLAEILAFNSVSAGLAVRTTGDPMALASFVREQGRALEPLWPIFQIEQLDDRFVEAVSQPRFYAVALGLFAALALVTAALGVYGVLAYAVERRRLEFSIRRALGATESGILRLVIGRAVSLAGLGLIVGLGAAAGGGSVLRSQLFGIEPLDAVSFILAAVILIAIVLLASWWPARRAIGANPVDALSAD